MTHTPGPWVNRTVGDPTDKSGGQIYAGKVNVATCHFGSHDTPEYDDYKANARLIAAAPELLEAAKFALSILGAYEAAAKRGENNLHKHTDCETVEMLIAAIAQAEGR